MTQEVIASGTDQLGDDQSIYAICKVMGHFDESYFPPRAKTQNAVLLPQEAFKRIEELEPFGYARVSPKNEPNDKGALVQVAAFNSEYDLLSHTHSGAYEACVRSTLQEKINVDPNRKDACIEITPYTTQSVSGLKVKPVLNTDQSSRDITTLGSVCYIHNSTRERLGISHGDTVEVLNQDTGFRVFLPTKTSRSIYYDENWIRLDRNTRKLLGIDMNTEKEAEIEKNITLRNRIDLPPQITVLGWWQRGIEWIGRRFVDYTTVRLQVIYGRDRDEDRNIVRLDSNTMKSLGIEEHDKLVLQWNGRTEKVRCLKDIDEDGTGPLEIRVPSTERDKLEVNVGDSLDVRRDMAYTAGNKISLSLFGILAVFVGIIQVLSVVGWPSSIVFLGTFVFLSTLTLYFVMMPERQKCR